MRPEHMPVLEGKEARRFFKQDKKPLNREQKSYLAKCQEIYEKNPLKLILINFDNINRGGE